MTVCFICTSPDVLPGHRVCAAHHDAAMCRKCRRNVREDSGYPTLGKPRTKAKTSPHTGPAMDALTALGGRATSKQIAAETGLTGNQVRAGLEAAGVRYEPNPASTKGAGGTWILEDAA